MIIEFSWTSSWLGWKLPSLLRTYVILCFMLEKAVYGVSRGYLTSRVVSKVVNKVMHEVHLGQLNKVPW